MKPPRMFSSKHRIGVIGILYSGKTVFITSLLNHIRDHDPELLRLKNGPTQITFNKELDPDNGIERFPYAMHRAEAHRVWPSKTEKTSQYRCSFFRSDWPWTEGELTLVDIPGERLSDIVMAGMDYQQWSDWVLTQMQEDRDPEYRKICTDYIQFLQSLGDFSRDPVSLENARRQIIERYSVILARLFLGFRPIVSPSAFVLAPNGDYLGQSVVDNKLSDCHPGLDAQRCFAPIPQEFAKKNLALVKIFSSHYEAYRREMAIPMKDLFKSCNELVVVVDVATILMGNTAMYIGVRDLVHRIVDLLDPGHSFFGTILGSVFGFWGIQRLAFVATKADLVQREQMPRLEGLLRQMTSGFINRLVETKNRLQCEYFACSAVVSTIRQEGGKLASIYPEPQKFGDKWVEVGDVWTPSDLPERWPDDWKDGDFKFRSVPPKFPKNIHTPPKHIKLEALLDFLLDPI